MRELSGHLSCLGLGGRTATLTALTGKTGPQKMRFHHNNTTWSRPFNCGSTEDAMHFCTWSAGIAVAIRKEHMRTLNTTLTGLCTCPSLQRALIEAVYCDLTVDDPFCPSTHSERAQKPQVLVKTAGGEQIQAKSSQRGTRKNSATTPGASVREF